MNNFRIHILMFIIPGIIGNVAHMLMVKKNLFSFFATPVSEQLFGENKTYRGFVVLPVQIGAVCLINSLLFGPFYNGHFFDLAIGFGLGLSYMLAELPNSFVKRKLGIASGQSGEKYKILQVIIDKTDSLLGACIFYFLVVKISVCDILLLFGMAFLLHISISFLLVVLKLKKSI